MPVVTRRKQLNPSNAFRVLSGHYLLQRILFTRPATRVAKPAHLLDLLIFTTRRMRGNFLYLLVGLLPISLAQRFRAR